MAENDGWGGARQGTPGMGYSNRTDLLTNRAPTGGGNAPAPTAPQGPAGPTPDDSPTPLTPSAYAGEPVTTGLPIGAGQGPEVMSPGFMGQPESQARRLVRALMMRDDNPDLRRLLARMDMTGA